MKNSDHIEWLKSRLKSEDSFFAKLLAKKSEELGEAELAEKLGTDETGLARLFMCRVPDTSRLDYPARLASIAIYSGIQLPAFAELMAELTGPKCRVCGSTCKRGIAMTSHRHRGTDHPGSGAKSARSHP